MKWPHLSNLSYSPLVKGALLLYVLPCCLLTNLVNLQHFPDLSNLPYSPLAVRTLLSCYNNYCSFLLLTDESGEI